MKKLKKLRGLSLLSKTEQKKINAGSNVPCIGKLCFYSSDCCAEFPYCKPMYNPHAPKLGSCSLAPSWP